jgi:hypothetical protein
VVGVGLIAMLTLVGWIAGFVLSGKAPRVTPSQPPAGPTAALTPQTVFRPLPVPHLTVAAEAGGVRFSWTYNDPAPGDFFRVQRTDVNDPGHEDVTAPTYFVQDDYACLQVIIIRANGQGGPSQTLCGP